MRVKDIYVGGWFQRTTLHLSEIYDFLREGTSKLSGLNPEKLKSLQENLNIKSVELTVDDLDYIELATNNQLTVKIFEDGLIVLKSGQEGEDKLSEAIEKLTYYYEEKLSQALKYIFSLGAPVPKELAGIKSIYPYFVVLEDASQEQAVKLLEEFEQKKYFSAESKHFDLFRGDKFYIINAKGEKPAFIARFVEEQIFLREFKAQLHHYLNLHRTIWERIAEVKERAAIKGSEISTFLATFENYNKTINLIETRINQMKAYLHSRERISKTKKELRDFFDVFLEYKYETLGNTLEYIKEIWNMTKNYVDASVNLFANLQERATENTIKNLTVITAMGVGATAMKLVAQEPVFSSFGVVYLVAVVLIGFAVDSVMKWVYRKRTYSISNVDYDKNIANAEYRPQNKPMLEDD